MGTRTDSELRAVHLHVVLHAGIGLVPAEAVFREAAGGHSVLRVRAGAVGARTRGAAVRAGSRGARGGKAWTGPHLVQQLQLGEEALQLQRNLAGTVPWGDVLVPRLQLLGVPTVGAWGGGHGTRQRRGAPAHTCRTPSTPGSIEYNPFRNSGSMKQAWIKEFM